MLTGLTLAAPAPPAHARQDAGVTLDVRAGFDGYIQQNAYFPITVTATNTGEDVNGLLRLRIDFTDTEYTRPLDLPRGSRKQVTFYAAGLTFVQKLRIELVERGRVVTSEEVNVQAVQAAALLVGVWSDTPQALASLAAVKPSSQQTEVAILTDDDLPPVGEAWRALDVLAVLNADTGTLDEAQRAALGEWLAQGGRLIILGGTSYQRTLAGLGEVSPVLANDSTTISLESLGAYWPDGFGQQVQLEAPVATGPLASDAEVLVEVDGVPLLAGRDVGYGRVDYLAADPGLEPLRSWDGMAGVWRGILAGGEGRPGWAYGFNLDSEFLQNAVANVPGISLPSVLQLCGFLMLYAALIGPANYFVLRRLKRQELAWVTIPALVLLFSGVAYVTGFQLRGSRAIVHRLAVVQVPSSGEVAKVDVLLGLWSPRRARYDVQLEAGYLARPMPRNLGTALTGGQGTVIEHDQVTALRDVRVDVGSIQPFIIEGATRDAPRITSRLEMQPAGSGIRIVGDVTNSSDVALADAVLVIGRDIFPVGNVGPGEALHIDQVAGYAAMVASPIDPIPYNPYGAPYYGYNTFVTQVAGVSDCWSVNDLKRRCDLAASLLFSEVYGRGVYLIGWSDDVPVDMTVLNATSEMVDLALYIIELDVAVAPALEAQEQIGPDQMQWTLLDNPQAIYFSSPYSFYMPGGSTITLRFEPFPGLYRDEFDSLVINMNQTYYYDDTTPTPQVEIRNFTRGRWDKLTLNWGDNLIQQAADYLDGVGGVELRLTIGPDQYLEFSQFDVTLLTAIPDQ